MSLRLVLTAIYLIFGVIAYDANAFETTGAVSIAGGAGGLSGYKTCQSSKEFKKAIQFLRNDPELELKDPQAVQLALEIAKGCDEASERFARIYLLLKKSGVDQTHALKTALEFVPMSTARAKGFEAIFQKVFLENYLNLDFSNAFTLSLALTRDYKGDVDRLKTDFLALVKYCLDEKGLALDFKVCTEVVSDTVVLSELFPKGVFPEFKKLYDYLRFEKHTGLNIRDALKIVPRVLTKGPTAASNFIDTMNFVIQKKISTASQIEALKIAMQVADMSLVKE